nr:hypothetical protein [uncultured Bacteroides sp.]
MKRFRNTYIIIATLLCSICFWIVGCQQDEEVPNASVESLSFLSITSNADLLNLSKIDWRAIKEAAKRINIEVRDGLFYIKQKSAEQINVSDELFSLFVDGVDKTNQDIKKSKIKLVKPQTRWDGEFTDEWSESDCVAQTITGTLMAMGAVIDGSVSAWVESQYGNDGVPFNEVVSVFDHYFDGHEVPIPVDGTHIGNSGAESIIAILRSGDGGHAVNLLSIQDGIIVYMDYQQGGIVATGFVTDIMLVYNVYGYW